MRLFTVILILNIFVNVLAQKNEQDRAWNQPVEPFRIAGDIYYVGAIDITSYLVTTPKGHILIDSGFIETVPQIIANVKKLGFKPEEIKVLLNSHAHYDHAGGLAELRRLTGATLMISEPDVELMANGGKGDPNFGDRFPFETVRTDKSLRSGERVKLGGSTLTANLTPGHTRGCTTWTTETMHQGRKLNAIFVCSTSAPGYKLFKNEKYPNIYADYLQTFAFLEKQRPDIFLGSHGAIYGLEEKIGRMGAGRDDAFIDPDGYKKYVSGSRAAIEETFKRQSSP
ncbi:MAG TPA: subclass B3 metallo-beta-lactamase [Pyrinomonadaceae bacterium]|nr:subclass B3 metallo-beta-lactamase [Pyrinomonadaceae bacterium]